MSIHHPPHSSVTGHLAIEIALLDALRRRSKHQHRSQPFLNRAQAVLRLVKLVQHRLTPPTSDIKHFHTPSRKVVILLHQLQRALSTAATVTSQIIHLHHFIPLQIMLLGSYSRLFAVSSHVLATFESSVEGRSPRPIGSHDVLDPKASADLIQSDRPIIVKSSPVTAGRQGRDLTNDTQMDLAVKRQLPPSDTASEEERLSKKRKGRSVMDDIFG